MKKFTRELHPNSIWDEEAVLDAFKANGIHERHFERFMRCIYDDFSTGKITALDQWQLPDSNMSPKMYNITRNGDFALMTTRVIRREDSQDKSTTKLLIELQDGEQIETVLMRYSNTQSQQHTRTTICLSSQIGCAQACTFCATGLLGLTGALTTGEILEQFIWANSQIEIIRNVVFMGQGEPLSHESYDQVSRSVRILTNSARFALAQSRVTVSTVGVVNNMIRIIDDLPHVTIALSLHAPTQTMREKIVPSARKYSLKELVDVIDHYHAVTTKNMLIEYVMLDDVNSSEDTAHLLGKLLQGRAVMVNLIPFNPVLTKAKHVAPSHETVATFARIVTSYGIMVTTRKEFGQDINGACGQLAASVRPIKKIKGYSITDDDDMKDDDATTTATVSTPSSPKKQSATIEEITPEEAAQENNTTTTTSTPNTTTKENESERVFRARRAAGDDEDTDVVSDGLEGLMSAMGWMNPDKADGNDEIAVTRSSILDNTGCSSEPADGLDMEDMYTGKKAAPAAATPAAPAPAKAEECGPLCACHREQRHIDAVKGLDPKDIMGWSLAIINLGPVLIHEQLARRGLTFKARVDRIKGERSAEYAASIAGSEPASESEVSVKRERSVIGSVSVGPWGVPHSKAISSLQLVPREKDLLPRVFHASREEKESIDLDAEGWDAVPERGDGASVDTITEETAEQVAAEEKASSTKTATKSTTAPVATLQQNKTPGEILYEKDIQDNLLDPQHQQKNAVIAVILFIITVLIARRLY